MGDIINWGLNNNNNNNKWEPIPGTKSAGGSSGYRQGRRDTTLRVIVSFKNISLINQNHYNISSLWSD